MQQRARTSRGWRQWTGRVLPVLAVALLAIGPAHTKDKDKKKKKREAEVAVQIERPAQMEQPQAGPPSPAEPPALSGKSKKSKDVSQVQNIREPSHAESRAASPVPMDRVIEEIQRRYKAKVVKKDTKRSGDKQVYELRLLSEEGRYWTVKVDTETGREL